MLNDSWYQKQEEIASKKGEYFTDGKLNSNGRMAVNETIAQIGEKITTESGRSKIFEMQESMSRFLGVFSESEHTPLEIFKDLEAILKISTTSNYTTDSVKNQDDLEEIRSVVENRKNEIQSNLKSHKATYNVRIGKNDTYYDRILDSSYRILRADGNIRHAQFLNVNEQTEEWFYARDLELYEKELKIESSKKNPNAERLSIIEDCIDYTKSKQQEAVKDSSTQSINE